MNQSNKIQIEITSKIPNKLTQEAMNEVSTDSGKTFENFKDLLADLDHSEIF